MMEAAYFVALVLAIAILPIIIAILRGVPMKWDLKASLQEGLTFSFTLFRNVIGQK
jgi:hypothetical protein